MHCTECGKELDQNLPGAWWVQVIGWERKREQGGTNHVALRVQQEVFMCNACMVLRQAGISPKQGALL
jgi:hypothetical protein